MMPYAAPSIRACGCVVASGDRCQHMVKRDRERKARFDQHRPGARQRGYDSKWEKARAAFLAVNPRCAHPGCNAAATVVDHKIPHCGDRKLFWQRSNWQPLCVHHHNSAKQREERR